MLHLEQVKPSVQYLDKVGATYYFRRVVPDDVRPYFLTASGAPRTDWKFSLGTKERPIAVERCNLMAVEYDALIRDVRTKRAKGIPPDHVVSTRATAEAARSAPREWAEFEAVQAGVEQDYRLSVEDDEAAEARGPQRRAIIKRLSRPTAEMSPAELAMRDLIADEEFLPQEEKARHAAERAAEWREAGAQAAAHFAEERSASSLSPTYPRLMDLFDSYVAERQPAPATVKRWRPVMDHFIAFLGHEDATQITKANVVAWKEALLAEKKPDGTPTRAALTVKETYLASLKVVLEFGRENGALAANAAADVKVRTPKKIRLRNPGFTDDEAVTILRATMEPQPDSLAPTHRLARRWVPWLCAYTGARVGEMSQLRTEDVMQIDGVWAVRITPDAGGVKSGKARIVPLHPHLIEQGFVAVATKAKGPLFYNPERGRGGKDANPHHKKIGERLGAWVRKLGVDDPEVQPNHAWRHRFETEMRRAKLDYEARHVLVGHAHQTESGTYGEWDAASLKREIDKLPHIDLTAKSSSSGAQGVRTSQGAHQAVE